MFKNDPPAAPAAPSYGELPVIPANHACLVAPTDSGYVSVGYINGDDDAVAETIDNGFFLVPLADLAVFRNLGFVQVG